MERAATAAANSIVLAVENIASSRDRVFWLNRYYAGINPCPWARALRRDASADEERGPRPARAGLPEQPPRGEIGALAHARELGPHHVLGDTAPARGGVEAAIGAGEHARGIADDLRDPLETVCHHLRMLDEIGQAVDHAGDQELVVP